MNFLKSLFIQITALVLYGLVAATFKNTPDVSFIETAAGFTCLAAIFSAPTLLFSSILHAAVFK